MMRRTRRDPAAEDTQTVERVRGALQSYLAEGGPGAAVSAGHVLDLLNPRGMWAHDPEYGKPAPPPAADGDPLTGCKPVMPVRRE